MKNENINIRVDPETKQDLIKLADSNRRTLSNMLDVIIKETLERLKKKEFDRKKFNTGILRERIYAELIKYGFDNPKKVFEDRHVIHLPEDDDLSGRDHLSCIAAVLWTECPIDDRTNWVAEFIGCSPQKVIKLVNHYNKSRSNIDSYLFDLYFEYFQFIHDFFEGKPITY